MGKTKIGALALSFAVASAMCVPMVAFADDAWTPGADIPASDNVTTSDATSSTVIKGVIKPTTLSVSVPTTVTFSVDPGAVPSFTGEPTSSTVGQFVSPSNYTITNNSRVPVYAAVTGVAVGSGGGLKSISLVDDPSALTAGDDAAGPKVMVAISDDHNAADSDGTKLSLDYSAATPTATGTWLATTISAAAPYYAFHEDDAATPNAVVDGKLAAGKDSTGAAVSDGTNKTTMYMYGAVKGEGWDVNDAFSVAPTFTIRTTAFA